MTGRARMLAALRGEETDRFPVWLKLANRTWQLGQPEPYRSMSEVDLLKEAGCDLMLGFGVQASAKPSPRVEVREARTATHRRLTTRTPDGDLVQEWQRDEQTDSWHPTRYPANTAEELKRLRWLFRNTEYSVAPSAVGQAAERQKRLVGMDAVSMSGVGPGPLMRLVEELCGPENWVFLMYDEPDLFGEVLQLIHEDRLRWLKAILPTNPADTLWLTENTSTSLISPDVFREHCVPHLREYGNLILENGLVPVHHMCGKLNAILEMVDGLPAMANEAYTTRPLGDVSLAEGRRRMPTKCLIGGTNATLLLRPTAEIVAEVAADVAACPDRRRIFLTSAGVLPPAVDMAKARALTSEFKRL